MERSLRMMRRALALGRRGLGKTAPNPAVGCVIARGDDIVGEGWHRKAGGPHAEIHALRAAGERARGADVYVTLEPCSHFGKTPPCCDALIAAGVSRVFAGTVDPNPLVAGEGLRRLREAGLEVSHGVLEQECRRLIDPFAKHVSTGLPFVTYKCAMTLDGRTAAEGGDSRWITCEKSRTLVHRLRSRSDAIMVGVGTVLADDPRLNVRMVRGRDPLRIVVDSTLRTPPSAVVCTPGGAPTILATATVPPNLHYPECVEILPCAAAAGGVDLRDLLRQLGRRGVQSVLLEGGGTLAGRMLSEGLIDRVLVFIAPKILGSGLPAFVAPGLTRVADSFRLRDMEMRRIGDDILVSGYPEASCSPA